jgi:hypothetical protein
MMMSLIIRIHACMYDLYMEACHVRRRIHS